MKMKPKVSLFPMSWVMDEYVTNFQVNASSRAEISS